MKGGMSARAVGGPDVTVAPLLMYPLHSERPDIGLQRPSCVSINLRLRFYGHLLVSSTYRMGCFPMVGRHIWPVLSRSWPSPHFLTRSHSDSRVEFIWYPPLVLLQSAKFREADHLALILQFLFWPCSVLAKPGSIWTGLPWPPFPPPREEYQASHAGNHCCHFFTFSLLQYTGENVARRELAKIDLWIWQSILLGVLHVGFECQVVKDTAVMWCGQHAGEKHNRKAYPLERTPADPYDCVKDKKSYNIR